MQNPVIISHPVIENSLAVLRNRDTDTQSFRRASDIICEYIILEALKDSTTSEIEVNTPLERTSAKIISETPVFIPILRSGIAMLNPVIKLFPDSPIGFAGLERDEVTAVARQYYWKLPLITDSSTVVICDPMLATGGSADAVIAKVNSSRPRKIKLVTVISAPEGVRRIHDRFPNVSIFTTALDRQLNSSKYILPGLGDYGDRYFGTE